MSAETTPKLETFLIVAYKPMRGSQKYKEQSLPSEVFNSMVSGFQISKRIDLLPEISKPFYRTCAAGFGKDKVPTFVALDPAKFYFTGKDSAPEKHFQLENEKCLSGCDLVLCWEDKLIVGVGQSNFVVVCATTGKALFSSTKRFLLKIPTYSGHSFYSAYGRGAKIVNHCLIMASNVKTMVLVPLQQFWDPDTKSGAERSEVYLHEFEDVGSVLEVDGLEFMDIRRKPRLRQQFEEPFDQIACITEKGEFSIIRVDFRRLTGTPLSSFETCQHEEANSAHKVINIPKCFLVQKENCFEGSESTSEEGMIPLTQATSSQAARRGW